MSQLPRLADAEILAARGPREALDPGRPYAWLVEPEPRPDGGLEDVAAVFVTGPECPFRCLMCDLWKHTTERATAVSSVAQQVEWALERLPGIAHVKIYNSGSFFDTAAVSPRDLDRIAERVAGKKTLIVECHPRLVNARAAEFARRIAPVKLQVAMGLETVDPLVLARLNKGMTIGDFDRAAAFLGDCGAEVRAFVLLGPPGHRGAQAVEWAKRSMDHASSLGVACSVVIPVRPGNGIMDDLERKGIFARPTLRELEAVLRHGLARGREMREGNGRGPQRGLVLADLWNIEDFFGCPACSAERGAAIRRMNLEQRPGPPLDCPCGSPRVGEDPAVGAFDLRTGPIR